jgi:hypothetical protein
MNRTLRHLLIAAALLFAQQAAHVHALSHFRLDVANSERGQKGTLGHPAAQCLLYHAVDSALPNCAAPPATAQFIPPGAERVVLPLPFQPRIEFDSRAPPTLS